MSAVAGDERGVIVECPSCHQKNRLSYSRLPEKTAVREMQDGTAQCRCSG
jgi:hypothetical protein